MKDEQKAKADLILELQQLRGELSTLQTTTNQYSDSLDQLRESEEKFRRFFETTGDACFMTTSGGRMLDFNDVMLELSGYDSREELQELPITDWYVDPEDRSRLIEEVMQTGYVRDFPTDLRQRDGSVINTLITSVAVKNDSGQLIGFQGTIRDITPRRQAELQLQQSEETSHAMLNALPDLIFVFDRQGRFLNYKSAQDDDLFIPPEIFIGKTVAEVMPPNIATILMEKLELTFAHRETQVWEYSLPINDVLQHFEARMVPKGEDEALTMVRNITDRTRLELERLELLQERQERIDELACLYGITETAHRHANLAELFQDTLRLIPTGWRYSDITCAQIRFDEKTYQTDQFRKTRWSLTSDLSVTGKRGRLTVGYLEERPDRDEGPFQKEERDLIDQIARILSEAIEHIQREEEVSKFKAISDKASFGSAILDLNGRITYINDYLAGLLGYNAREVLGRHIRKFFNKDQFPAVKQIMKEVARSSEFKANELWFRHQEGHLVPLLTSGAIIKTEQNRPRFLATTAIDIAENKKMERQIQQAQKMESIGLLAGGVAHDFNNILTVINGHSEMSLLLTEQDERLHTNLQAIHGAGQRAAKLTRQLLAFSRKQIYKPQNISLNQVITDLGKMLNRLIDEDIVMDTILGSDVGNIMADTGQIEQILMNLVINARDAIKARKTGGKMCITIETGLTWLDQAYVDSHPGSATGPHVCFSVSDTGVGMDEQTRNKIFEPFFTTKELGKGTGLGLAMVYGIIKQNQGSIYAYSEPGKGTSMKIYWPCSDKKQADTAITAREASTGGSETVLLAEDDPSLRELISLALEDLGYNIYATANGEEALQLFNSGEIEEELSLVITDVVMPKMGGRELADTITASRPQVKILYTSGYTDKQIVVDGALSPDMNFLQKPFTVQKLAKEVREVLDS